MREPRPDLEWHLRQGPPIRRAVSEQPQPLFGVVEGQLELGDSGRLPAAGRQNAGEATLDGPAAELRMLEAPAQILLELGRSRCVRRVLEHGCHHCHGGTRGAVERADAPTQRQWRVVGQQHELPHPETRDPGRRCEREPDQVAPSDPRVAGEVHAHGQHQDQLAGSEPPAPRRVRGEYQRQQDGRRQPAHLVQHARHQQSETRCCQTQRLGQSPFGPTRIDDDQGIDEADEDSVDPDARHRSNGEPCDRKMHDEPCGQRRQRRARAVETTDGSRIGGVEPLRKRDPAARQRHVRLRPATSAHSH